MFADSDSPSIQRQHQQQKNTTFLVRRPKWRGSYRRQIVS